MHLGSTTPDHPKISLLQVILHWSSLRAVSRAYSQIPVILLMGTLLVRLCGAMFS